MTLGGTACPTATLFHVKQEEFVVSRETSGLGARLGDSQVALIAPGERDRGLPRKA